MRGLLVIAMLAACGRFDFDASLDATPPISGPITHANAFVNVQSSALSTTHTFAASAQAAGDLVLLHIYCGSVDAATSMTLTAPNWAFTELGQIGNDSVGEYVYTVAAIAPDTTSATFTVVWTTTSGCQTSDDLGDEFGGTYDLATAIDSHDETTGDNDCVASVTTRHADDAVWAGCTTLTVSGIATGYTKGADDGHGDWTEYRLASDPDDTVESPTFTNTSGKAFVMTAVALSAR